MGGAGDGRVGEGRDARCGAARCEVRPDAYARGVACVGRPFWLRSPFNCAALLAARLRGGGDGGVVGCRWRRGSGAVGALNDASALAVGALEPVLDLIALDEGGYQRAHRAHLRRRVQGWVPQGMLHVAQRQGAAVRAESGGEWRGVVAWRGGVEGAEGVQQGRSPAGRRVRFAGGCGRRGATEPPRKPLIAPWLRTTSPSSVT